MKRKITQPVDNDTRQKIISAALQVFAKNGFSAGTVREITEVADVNIAAVNYHFTSKDELIKHVLEDKIAPIIAIRLDFLEACVHAAKPDSPSVEALAEALVRPLVELGSGQYREVMMLLMHARTTALQFITEIVENQFQPLHEKFVDVMQRSLPELSRTEIALRYDCARGAVLQTLVSLAPAAMLVSGIPVLASQPHELAVKRLVSFVSAGLSAPPA